MSTLSKTPFYLVALTVALSLGVPAAFADIGSTMSPLDHEIATHKGTRIIRLLPVHYDPSHAAEVERRLSEFKVGENALPSDYEIPHKDLPPIRDQGRRGSCAYFATVGLLENYYNRLMSSPPSAMNLSEECLLDVRNWMFDQGANYTGADKPDQRPDPDGDLPQSIVQTITQNGVPAALKFGSTDCTYMWSGTKAISLQTYQDLFKGSATYAYGKGLSFDQNSAPTVEAIESLISQNIPVEVGILVYNSFFNTSSWEYSVDSEMSGLAGAHAVILTGYHRSSGDHVVFTFKNSWGLEWGKSGYGTLNNKLLEKSWGYDPTMDFVFSLH